MSSNCKFQDIIFKVCDRFHVMGVVQLYNQSLLLEIEIVLVFSSVAMNSFASKSLLCTELSFNSHFSYSYHSFQPSWRFLVWEEIQNCFIMDYIFWTFLLKELRLTEPNNGLDAEVFQDVTGTNKAPFAGVGRDRSHTPTPLISEGWHCSEAALFQLTVVFAS